MSSSTNSLLIGILSFLAVAAGEGGHTTIKLSDFQRVLQSSLDNELAKLADGSAQHNSNVAANLPNQRNLHTKRKSNMRRKANNIDVDDVQSLQESSDGISSFSTEGMWVNLIEHSWNAAQTIKRDERLSITSNPEETQPTPFLICTPRGLKYNGIDTVQSILGTFDKQYDSVVVSSSLDETCIVVTTTALQARQALDKDQTLVTMPLIDISKIHSGTIDEVSSQGWSVPKESSQQERKNETESMNNWERIISVDFVPGLGGMKEESQILKVVNDMMGDIQDMAEVGWLRSIGKEEAEQYMIAESLVGVPALSDLFSLTSTSVTKVTGDEGNTRVAFWHDAFKYGIQAEHACSDMFSTLFVKPRAGYFGYDLVLNPSDGPPPQEYISSASNPACVTSYLAALSTHPYVLSVKANFPIYHGWHVAQKLDAAKK